MRTCRWILVVGAALLAIGWLGAAAVRLTAGESGQLGAGLSGVASLGLVLTVVGAEGLLMVLIVRRVIGKRS